VVVVVELDGALLSLLDESLFSDLNFELMCEMSAPLRIFVYHPADVSVPFSRALMIFWAISPDRPYLLVNSLYVA
jgi:hypothetical protein